MKQTRDECEKALKDITYSLLRNSDTWKLIDGNRVLKSHYQREVDIIKQLINEHFDNTPDFKGFKLHNDSTLKSFTKDELIDYIHMVYSNWQSTDWYLNNSIKRNKELSEEIEELKSNPPIKYEELYGHEDEWAWDNENKEWFRIIDCIDLFYELGFDKDRYYRKQVKE